jgi:type I restriction enzyme S subunit
VSWYGNSEGQEYFVREGKQTTNLASLNLTKLGQLPVPIPPAAEQRRIVAELDRRISILDELQAATSANIKRAERLRQAILKRAFEGKLVPQDPTDEPSSVLLERIRAERNGIDRPSRQRKTRRVIAPKDLEGRGMRPLFEPA